MSDLAFRSATDLCHALRRREVGSLELLDHLLERVERLNSGINAVVATQVDAARERARTADEAIARGESWGPLHGLPMTIKDSFEVVGMPTTSGAPELAQHRPETNASAVQRLVDAGAVVFGKTNLPLYASDLQSYNEVYGTTNNPWDTSRIPGGSSGGAAAALAAGLTPLELGSDIGGSIRNPAHFCGVYGHKPTHGTVPVRGHIPGPPGALSEPDLAVAGPLARDPRDLELALDVLAGPDDLEGAGWRLDLPPARHPRLRDYRVALWLDDPTCPISADSRDLLQGAADAVARAGARVDEAKPDLDSSASHLAYLHLLNSVMGTALTPEQYEQLRQGAAGIDPSTPDPTAQALRGMVLSHREWLVANERRQHLRRSWAELFRDYDVLLCPVSATPAFPHDHSEFATRTIDIDGVTHPYLVQLFWAGVITAPLLPSTVVPVGRTPSGLPVGLQVVSAYLEDRNSLRFAQLLEDVTGGFEAPPGYAG
jgi:amidase